MMAIITGIEFLNGKFDPINARLDGWSESIGDNIYDYDEVFEELHDKYGGETEVAPEIKLIMMVVGSAFMFHLSNTLFKSSIPGMDDVLKKNPELMQQFANAAVNSMNENSNNQPPAPKPQVNTPPSTQGPNLNNLMGGLMGGIMGGDLNQMMGGGIGDLSGLMSGMNKRPKTTNEPHKPEPPAHMKGADNINKIIGDMNINPDDIDLDSISVASSNDNDNTITLNI